MSIKTELMLMAQFEKVVIPLEDICEEFFGLKEREARRKANNKTLPVPAFQMGGQRSPWMVHLSELAKYIDSLNFSAAKTKDKIDAA